MQAAAPKPKAIRRAHPGQGVPMWRASKWPKQRSCVENGERGLGRDHLYSVAALTNQAGSVVERYRYSSYGERTVLAADGITTRAVSLYGQQIGFTGRYLDKETGLWYFRARYYSGTLGRFVGRDPADYVDGMSLYNGYYVPNKLDPSGLNVTIYKRGPFCKEDGNVYLALVIAGLGKDEGLYGDISITGSYYHYKTGEINQINKSIYVYNHAGPMEDPVTGSGGTYIVKKDKADEYNRMNWIVLINSEIKCKCSVTIPSVKASFSYRVVKENNPGRFGWNPGRAVIPNFWFWNQVSHGMTRSDTPPELYSPYKRDSVEIDVTWNNPGIFDHSISSTSNDGQGGEVPDSPWNRMGR